MPGAGPSPLQLKPWLWKPILGSYQDIYLLFLRTRLQGPSNGSDPRTHACGGEGSGPGTQTLWSSSRQEGERKPPQHRTSPQMSSLPPPRPPASCELIL